MPPVGSICELVRKLTFLYICKVVSQPLESWSRAQSTVDCYPFSLEKRMSTHSNILAWRIPWTEEAGGLQSMGSHRVGHD